MLSARTRDETAIRAAEILFRKFRTIRELARATKSAVASVIRPVNFYKTKAKNVCACARALVEDYRGSVPMRLSDLVKLPGVGRKTANVLLAEYGASAIGVDTHVSHISQRLGWTGHRDPAGIENDLMRLFPRHLWVRVNRICVRFGKTHTGRREKDVILKHIRVSAH